MSEDRRSGQAEQAIPVPPMAPDTRAAIYDVIHRRRDVRRGFLPDQEVSLDVLARVLGAAHAAPSVGFMQPWRFLLIGRGDVRERLRRSFERASDLTREALPDEDLALTYSRLKLQAFDDAPLVLAVTCDTNAPRGHGLGRRTWPQAARDSTVAAVQNLMLAARCEGLGTGWVSILEPVEVRAALELPEGVEPVAILCIGHVDHFEERPELETAGWAPRVDLGSLVRRETYDGAIVEMPPAAPA